MVVNVVNMEEGDVLKMQAGTADQITGQVS